MLKWKPFSGQYITGKYGYIGKYRGLEVFYDGSTSRGETKKYRLKCKLPGIKDDFGLFATEDEAMKYGDWVYSQWLIGANLQEVPVEDIQYIPVD